MFRVPGVTAVPPTLVFVFLGEGFGASRWQDAWRAGQLPGLCERLPYGYFHAADRSWHIKYSEDRQDSLLRRTWRLGLRKLLGFDLIHAWDNREQLAAADVVWTHTEREHLALLCLWGLQPPARRPKLIAQSVWLFDKWRSFSGARRWFYRKLIDGADLLTVLSPENLKEARRLFPNKRCELVQFGIGSTMKPIHRKTLHKPIRLLSPGSDMHRDWDTLVEAVRNRDDVEVRILNRTLRPKKTWPSHISIVRASTAQEVADLYGWADLVVVALKDNLHASGITVIAEAMSFGLPVVCTDTGGLRAYFSNEEVRYVPSRDPAAIRFELDRLAADDEFRLRLARRAQEKLLRGELTSRAYAISHRRLSESLLQGSDSWT